VNKPLILLVFAGLILGILPAVSQNELKIGHANLVEILEALPETDSARQLIEKDTKELELMLEDMQVEYNKFLDEYQENLATYSEVIRSAKEADIVEMQDRIQTFQQHASQQLQEKGSKLMQPIYDRIQRAIDEVGKREGFAYILDTSKGSVVFTGAASHDIGSMIRAELGIMVD
jgi:outer membrane protein